MTDTRQQAYQQSVDALIAAVRDRICRPCAEAGENLIEVNFNNPIECRCSCPKVIDILDNVSQMLTGMGVRNK